MSRPGDGPAPMRDHAIAAIVEAFLKLPDTPPHASPRDFAIAGEMLTAGWTPDQIILAIRLGFIRRSRAMSDALSPIRSLAYFARVLEGLTPDELGTDYAAYVSYTFAALTGPACSRTKSKSQSQPDRKRPR